MLNRKAATSGAVADFGNKYGGWAVVFHHRLISWLDKFGNCRADPYWLKSQVVPRVPEVTPDICKLYLSGLVDAGLVVLYSDADMQYLHMPGFKEEQVGLNPSKEKPECPTPTGYDEVAREWPDRYWPRSGNDPEIFRKDSGKESALSRR